MKKTETKAPVVQNLELYKDYLGKYEDGKWAQQIQKLAEKVKEIDNTNQTERAKVLEENKKAMDNIVDKLPPEFSLICKIVDGINNDKKMNILLFPIETEKSFQRGHELYESDISTMRHTYNDKYIQNALKTYKKLLESGTPFAIIYVTHHKYLFLHCEVAVHCVDNVDNVDKEKKTQKILETNLDLVDGGTSFDKILYKKAINLSDKNKAGNTHNDKSSSSTTPETITFKRNNQPDRIGCVINAIKFATSALKNIKKYNNLISQGDLDIQQNSIQKFLNSIVPDDNKLKIKSTWDIEPMFKDDAQEDTRKHILWLNRMYKYFNLDYDSKEKKLKLKDFPKELVSSGYRKYSQNNRKYLSNIGINESKLNPIYLKDKNKEEWNVGTFLKLKTLSKEYLDVDFMNVRDNIVMALTGRESRAKTMTPGNLKYNDIEKKWEENNKNKQVKQKKESKNEKNDGNKNNSEKDSNKENNIQTSQNIQTKDQIKNDETKNNQNNKAGKVKDKEKDSKKGKNGNGNQNKKDSNETSKVNITTKEQMKYNLLVDYEKVIFTKNKELVDLLAKQSRYNNKQSLLNEQKLSQEEVRKREEDLRKREEEIQIKIRKKEAGIQEEVRKRAEEIRKREEDLRTTKKLENSYEIDGILEEVKKFEDLLATTQPKYNNKESSLNKPDLFQKEIQKKNTKKKRRITYYKEIKTSIRVKRY